VGEGRGLGAGKGMGRRTSGKGKRPKVQAVNIWAKKMYPRGKGKYVGSGSSFTRRGTHGGEGGERIPFLREVYHGMRKGGKWFRKGR